jgi:hypothetical protein
VNPFLRKRLKRFLQSILLSLPGVALAMGAKPFNLGETALFFGILVAFASPLIFLRSSD